jgi:hypothetical protein
VPKNVLQDMTFNLKLVCVLYLHTCTDTCKYLNKIVGFLSDLWFALTSSFIDFAYLLYIIN